MSFAKLTSTSLSSTDNLSCKVFTKGSQLMSFDVSGVKSMKEIYSMIVNEMGSFKGLITLNVRNRSQGWSNEYRMLLAGAA